MQPHRLFPPPRDEGIALLVLTMILMVIAGLSMVAATVLG